MSARNVIKPTERKTVAHEAATAKSATGAFCQFVSVASSLQANSSARRAPVPSYGTLVHTAPSLFSENQRLVQRFNEHHGASAVAPPVTSPLRHATSRCCPCSRRSTCSLAIPSFGGKAPPCACKQANRSCTSCACLHHCRNTRAILPTIKPNTLHLVFSPPAPTAFSDPPEPVLNIPHGVPHSRFPLLSTNTFHSAARANDGPVQPERQGTNHPKNVAAPSTDPTIAPSPSPTIHASLPLPSPHHAPPPSFPTAPMIPATHHMVPMLTNMAAPSPASTLTHPMDPTLHLASLPIPNLLPTPFPSNPLPTPPDNPVPTSPALSPFAPPTPAPPRLPPRNPYTRKSAPPPVPPTVLPASPPTFTPPDPRTSPVDLAPLPDPPPTANLPLFPPRLPRNPYSRHTTPQPAQDTDPTHPPTSPDTAPTIPPLLAPLPLMIAPHHPQPPLPPLIPDVDADLFDYIPTAADHLLNTVYGDHAHDNAGTHLTGNIPDDPDWQRRWLRVVQLASLRYQVPSGKVGRRFLTIFTQELRGVRSRRWNSERPLVFVAVILQSTPGVRRSADIRQRLTQRMDLWEHGLHQALVDDTESEALSHHPSSRPPSDDSKARAFHSRVLSGRLRSAVRTLTGRDGGGVLQPDDLCTKTGRPVWEVLQNKHPELRDPVEIGSPDSAFEPYVDLPTAIPLCITQDDVEIIASRLSGAAGPSGTDAVDLSNWLLRFGPQSEALRSEMAAWTNWLANTHPPWAAYRAMMANRLVALDKQPGTRPVGIGEIYRRLWAKCLLKAIGNQATSACGNFNLCAGLQAGIEGAVHAVRGAFQDPTHIPSSSSPPSDPNTSPTFTPPLTVDT